MQAWGEPAPSASSALAAPRDSAAPSALERQILELEAQKTAAFDRDDMEECTRLRDRQMLLLEQPGAAVAPICWRGVTATVMRAALCRAA